MSKFKCKKCQGPLPKDPKYEECRVCRATKCLKCGKTWVTNRIGSMYCGKCKYSMSTVSMPNSM